MLSLTWQVDLSCNMSARLYSSPRFLACSKRLSSRSASACFASRTESEA